MKFFGELSLTLRLGCMKTAERLFLGLATAFFHLDRAAGGRSMAIRKAYFFSAKKMMSTLSKIGRLEASLWMEKVSFPESGWSRRAGLKHWASQGPLSAARSNVANAALADPRLPWGSPEPSDIEGIRALLSAKAAQISGTAVAPYAAQSFLELIPPGAETHSSFFRGRLDELDPGWHLRTAGNGSAPDFDLAASALSRHPEASAAQARAKEQHGALLEAEELAEAARPTTTPDTAARQPRRRL